MGKSCSRGNRVLIFATVVPGAPEFFVLRLGEIDKPWGIVRYGRFVPLYLRWELSAQPEMHQILALEYTGRAVVNVSEVRLTHRRFDKSSVAYGKAPLGGRNALFVITEDSDRAQMSIHVQPGQSVEDAKGEGHAEGGNTDSDDVG
jgi:hypothetical protein